MKVFVPVLGLAILVTVIVFAVMSQTVTDPCLAMPPSNINYLLDTRYHGRFDISANLRVNDPARCEGDIYFYATNARLTVSAESSSAIEIPDDAVEIGFTAVIEGEEVEFYKYRATRLTESFELFGLTATAAGDGWYGFAGEAELAEYLNAEPIEIGQVIAGSLQGQTDRYEFSLVDGEVVSIDLEAESGSFGASIEIIDASGQRIAYSEGQVVTFQSLANQNFTIVLTNLVDQGTAEFMNRDGAVNYTVESQSFGQPREISDTSSIDFAVSSSYQTRITTSDTPTLVIASSTGDDVNFALQNTSGQVVEYGVNQLVFVSLSQQELNLLLAGSGESDVDIAAPAAVEIELDPEAEDNVAFEVTVDSYGFFHLPDFGDKDLIVSVESDNPVTYTVILYAGAENVTVDDGSETVLSAFFLFSTTQTYFFVEGEGDITFRLTQVDY